MRVIVLDANAEERRLVANVVQHSFPSADVYDGSEHADVDRLAAAMQAITDPDRVSGLGRDIQAAALFPLENPNPVLRIARDGTVLFANRASERFLKAYGINRGGPLPERWRQLVQAILDEGKERRIQVAVEGDVIELDAVPILGAGYLNAYGRNVTDQVRRTAELEATLDAITDGVVIHAPDGRVRRLNAAARQMLGYQPAHEQVSLAALRALLQAELLDDPGAGPEQMPAARALKGETVRGCLMRIRPPGKADGVPMYVMVSAAPIRDRDNNMLGSVASFSDVSELRRARDELELRVQERTVELTLQTQRLEILHEIDRAILAARAPDEIAQAAVEHMQRLLNARRVAVALFDFAADAAEILAFAGVDSAQLTVGSRWSLSTGWMIHEVRAGRVASIADLAGLPDADPWKAERLAQGIHSATIIPMQTGDQVIGQLTIHRAQVGHLPAEIMELALHVTDSLALAVNNARLNQELVQRQAALVQANEALRYQANLLANVNDAIIAYDGDLRVTAWNHRAEELYGWQAEEVMGTYASDAVGSQTTEDERASILAALAETGRWQGEIRHARRDGMPIIVEATAVALRDDAGHIFAQVTVNRDITERKRMENELRASRARLQSLSRRLVELQENERFEVANQLYNDEGQRLAALLLGLGRLRRNQHIDPADAALLAEMMEMADGVLSDMHSLAVNLRPAVLDRLGLSAALRQRVIAFGQRSGVRVECELSALQELHLPIHVEASIYRIVEEALANVAHHADATCVSVSAVRRNDLLIVVFEDDGVGFNVAEAEQMGGLGLLAMRERAEAMGGSLSIESVPGKGTTLCIQLPEHDR